ncbi:MAG: hypothetical protein HXO91_10765, partial [Streptococcus sanguinis]|nr:hypothetical protein [Streptococcus sanguinis]
YITWSNKNGCPTGPARGSSGGSLVLHCIGVTKNIDPIQNSFCHIKPSLHTAQ